MALYSGGVIVASTSQACTSCSMIFETRASILKAGCSRSARMLAVAAALNYADRAALSAVLPELKRSDAPTE